MAWLRQQVALALALGLCSTVAHAALLLVDSADGAYIRGGSKAQMSRPQLGGLISALTGLSPPHVIDAAGSKQIAGLVKPSTLRKPKAHVSLAVAGLGIGDVKEVFAGRNHVETTLEGEEHEASAAQELVVALAGANPEVRFQLLEKLAAEKCNDASCITAVLPLVAEAVGGTYDKASNKLKLADGSELDMSHLPDKLLATELAGAMAGLHALLESHTADAANDIIVMDLSMLGLQGLQQHYSDDQQKLDASKDAVKQMLVWMKNKLDEAFGGDLTVQVALFDSAPNTASMNDVLGWKQQRNSRLLQAVSGLSQQGAFPGPDEVNQANIFSAKAAAYGGFVLLVYFLLAGVYGLCFMPFKKDSLLYGGKKND